MEEENINQMVLLLSISKKDDDESLNDVLLKIAETGSFSLKEAKQLLKRFKKDQLIIDDRLSFIGITKAKEAERFFKV